MGRVCRVCRDIRPNEAFGGKGDRRFICKRCYQRRRAERREARRAEEARGAEDARPAEGRQDPGAGVHGLSRFLEQSNISKRNVHTLERIADTAAGEAQAFAQALLEVARLHPRRRGRVRFLARHSPALLTRIGPHLSWFCSPECDDLQLWREAMEGRDTLEEGAAWEAWYEQADREAEGDCRTADGRPAGRLTH